MSAAESMRRCSELEDQLASVNKRAMDAEKCAEKLRLEVDRYQKQATCRAIRLKLLALVRQFHPDKTSTTTPTEVTKALTALLEDLQKN